MLVVSRRDDESILIQPGKDIDPTITVGDLFQGGPIEVTVFSTGSNRVKMGVQAPKQLTIWRKDGSTV